MLCNSQELHNLAKRIKMEAESDIFASKLE
jgi:hypothetical protein